jgi:predicted PhzF superfamily epimerase YddE/YHI9
MSTRTTPNRHFKQVDVFTATPYLGNPLAVVLDGSGLSTDQMQRFTDWTNLSEATFLLPPEHPDADYRVRIFCPGRELPFAGHPTLGSCHAWLQAGGTPKNWGQTPITGGGHASERLGRLGSDPNFSGFIVQECGVGLVKLRQSQGPYGQRLAFAAPPLVRSGPLPEADVALIARGLGIPRSDILHHAWCHNGPQWRGVMLASSEQVLALRPDGNILAGLDVGVVGPRGKVGVLGARPDGDGCAFEIRAFFHIMDSGVKEDPVTGSLNAAVAQWLIGAGLAPSSYVAAQGTAMGRAGRVHVEQVGADIWIGGDSVTCIEGSVQL